MVLRLPGWFQKTDAAQALPTVFGPVDATESRIVLRPKVADRSRPISNIILAVRRSVDTVKDIEQRRLGRISLPAGRLPLAEVLGVGQMETQTCQHKSLEHFGDCR